jgi:hypothetical protein
VCALRPCSFVSDWWAGTIPSRIASLIYINFDEPERFRAQSDVNEQGLNCIIASNGGWSGGPNSNGRLHTHIQITSYKQCNL